MKKQPTNRKSLTACRRQRGTGVIAAIVAVILLAVLGAGVAYFASSGQQMRIQQVTSDQSFYTAQAGMEFGLGQILEDDWTGSTVTRDFSGGPFTITRSSGNMSVSSAKIDAEAYHSITDPSPPTAGCLTVNTANASISGNDRMIGITLNRTTGHSETVVITSMTGTAWAPDRGELLTEIQIAGGEEEFSGDTGSGGAFDFGSDDYTIADNATHSLSYIEWDDGAMTNHNFDLVFNYTCGGNPETETVQVSITEKQSDYFVYGDTACRLAIQSGIWKRVEGCGVANSGTDSITIDKIAVSWAPLAPERRLAHMRLDGNILINSNMDSGEVADVNYLLADSTAKSIDYYLFSEEMFNYNYGISWTFADGSTAVSAMTLFAADQSACLNINTSNAGISGADIVGITVENTCSADIGMTQMSISWSGEGSRRFTRMEIDDVDGASTHTGNYTSGEAVSFGNRDLYYLDGLGPKAVTLIRFNNTVTGGLAFTLTFTMADGTVKTVVFTPGAQSACLNVNASGCSLQNSDRDLRNCTIGNTCGPSIVWTQTNMSWAPVSPSRTFQALRVDGVNLWDGSASSGATVNNSDYTITIGPEKTIEWFRWNSSMSGRTLTVQFIMGDGTVKTVTLGPY